MQIVADSSALIALASCDSLVLLDMLFDDVRVPQAVYDEVAVRGKPQADVLARWLIGRIEGTDPRGIIEDAGGLGRGELAAMLLFRRLSADLLLVDDRLARRVAAANGISVIGSLGVLVTAKKRGLLERVSPLLDVLRQSDIRFAETLLAEALRLAGEV